MNDERTTGPFAASTLGLTLLRAGRDEWPSDAAVSRTIAAVGAGAAVIAVASGAAGAGMATAKGSVALVSFGSVMKWLGMGALGGIVVAGVAHGITPAPPRAPLVLPSPALAPLAPAPPAAEVPKPKRAVELGAPESVVEAPKPVAPAPAVEREANDALQRNPPLAAEVAMVDRARTSLASGRPARALEELRGYEAAFPEPRLEPEVLFLRMEAHVAAGDATRARQTAAQSIRLFPKSPHAARARSVLEAAPPGEEK